MNCRSACLRHLVSFANKNVKLHCVIWKLISSCWIVNISSPSFIINKVILQCFLGYPQIHHFRFYARQHIVLSAYYLRQSRMSVRPSVCHVLVLYRERWNCRTGHCKTGHWRTGHWRTEQWRTGHWQNGHCRTGLAFDRSKIAIYDCPSCVYRFTSDWTPTEGFS